MKVYLDYLDGGKGMYAPDDNAQYGSDFAEIPRWAFWLYRLGARLQFIAWRQLRNVEPIN